MVRISIFVFYGQLFTWCFFFFFFNSLTWYKRRFACGTYSLSFCYRQCSQTKGFIPRLHLTRWIYLSSRQYIITIVICSRLKPQTENFSYVQNPGCLENKRKEKKKISLTNFFLSQYLTARIISFPEIIISFIQFFQCLGLAVEGATLTLVTCLVKKCFESSLENLR